MPNCNNCGALLSPETRRPCWRCGHSSAAKLAARPAPPLMLGIYVVGVSALVLGAGWLGISRWHQETAEPERAVVEVPSTPEPTQVAPRALQPDAPAPEHPEPSVNALGAEAPAEPNGANDTSRDDQPPARSEKAKAPKTPRASSSKVGAMDVRFGSVSVSGRLPSSVLMDGVRERKSKVEACYQSGQGNDIQVRFIVGRDGKVSNVAHVKNTLPSSASSCVIQSFYGMTFPKPEGGIVIATVGVTFSPR